MPLVSVVVPTHNRPHMLAEALASVRAQTFSDYEIIVVSNGESADDINLSRAAAVRYGAAYYVLRDGNVSAARNFGINLARGQWIAFLDDDDVWLPAKLERQLAEAASTGADMIVCGHVDIKPDGSERPPKDYPEGWPALKALCHQKWVALPSNVLITRAAVAAASGFDVRQVVNEDCDLWRRVAWRHRIHRMPDVLTKRRIGHVSLSGDSRRTYRYELRHQMKMLRDTPRDLRWALPSFVTLILRPVMKIITPAWLRQPRKHWEALRPLLLRQPRRG